MSVASPLSRNTISTISSIVDVSSACGRISPANFLFTTEDTESHRVFIVILLENLYPCIKGERDNSVYFVVNKIPSALSADEKLFCIRLLLLKELLEILDLVADGVLPIFSVVRTRS